MECCARQARQKNHESPMSEVEKWQNGGFGEWDKLEKSTVPVLRN